MVEAGLWVGVADGMVQTGRGFGRHTMPNDRGDHLGQVLRAGEKIGPDAAATQLGRPAEGHQLLEGTIPLVGRGTGHLDEDWEVGRQRTERPPGLGEVDAGPAGLDRLQAQSSDRPPAAGSAPRPGPVAARGSPTTAPGRRDRADDATPAAGPPGRRNGGSAPGRPWRRCGDSGPGRRPCPAASGGTALRRRPDPPPARRSDRTSAAESVAEAIDGVGGRGPELGFLSGPSALAAGHEDQSARDRTQDDQRFPLHGSTIDGLRRWFSDHSPMSRRPGRSRLTRL